jgi:mRNA interferase RelE/StbE
MLYWNGTLLKMIYPVSIKQSAVKALEKVTREDRIRIIAAIDLLKINPAAGGVLKGEFSGLRRIRVGNYRVVYEVQDQRLVVLVIRIGHRREVYR